MRPVEKATGIWLQLHQNTIMNNLGAIFSFFNVQTAQFNQLTWQIETLVNSHLYVAFWSSQFVNFFLPSLDPIAGTSQTQNPKSKIDTIMIDTIMIDSIMIV